MGKRLLPTFLLLFAFALRAWQLTAVPPGLTHDEAGHGHDAAHILKGVTLIYFTVGYGREPLFDYVNAGLIAGMGANPFTLRFAAVVWGMIALAATYRVARIAYDRNTALLALGLMAVSFWPLATSRQILRSAMLPAEMAIAVILFLKLTRSKKAIGPPRSAPRVFDNWLVVIGLGLTIAASLYTYVPARALWLMFPLALLAHYALRFTNRQLQITDYRLLITRLSISLLLAFLLASPLFLYLYQHPEAEQRIGMLSEPLTALRNGDPSPIVTNARESILAFFLPGHGDHFLVYTIPGKPIFDPITASLAFIGLILLIKWSVISNQWKDPAPRPLITVHYSLFLFWLALGLAPSLVTGPEALTTRIIGAQPVLYILPALGLVTVGRWLLTAVRSSREAVTRSGRSSFVICSLFIVSLFIVTVRDYFFVWGQSPDVRAAYQSTLIAMLKTIDGPTVVSTVYPEAPHDPYIAELITTHETRWVDGRFAMIYPAGADWRFVIPASTPLHYSFAITDKPGVGPVHLRPDDLDPYFTVAGMPAVGLDMDTPAGQNFNDAVELAEYQWLSEAYRPGDVAELMIWLGVFDTRDLGPVHPSAFKTDLNLFTHILNPDGTVFLQQDRLDAPSWDWQAGDIIMQIHRFAIPPDAAPGEYAVEVGLYDRITGDRLTVIDSGADSVRVDPLIIR